MKPSDGCGVNRGNAVAGPEAGLEETTSDSTER